ncbi:MAG: hypothetical protein O2955_10385 [Planctomycetota bacterium]|nr:hypothetical protein [Planctomycetota bacterium]MDA1212918.1 hypothetical protein [Planctomycetota bacterium]
MYFRFASGIILVVLIALVGVGLEKETLSLRREVSRQHFRTEILVENKAKLRWECEQLGAPQRLIEQLPPDDDSTENISKSPAKTKSGTRSKSKSKSKKTAQIKALPLL